jgi:Tol biopolymer transport system component
VSVMRLGGQEARRLAELDPAAIDVSVSADGTRIAYALANDGIYLVTAGDAAPTGRRLGAGDLPRISPDGSSVLAVRGGASVVVGADGRELARLSSNAAGWISCGERCQS